MRWRSVTLPSGIVAERPPQLVRSTVSVPVSYRALRSLLFRLEPETAHSLAFRMLSLVSRRTALRKSVTGRLAIRDDRLSQRILGLDFSNPVGLAAGLDKDAAVLPAWSALGFGFAEVGTVTPRAQKGNPRPRLFRYPEAHSLQNRMGFNSQGMESMRLRLEGEAMNGRAIPVGINVGKNRDTPIEEAEQDYEELLTGLKGLGDYFVINVSSPNTPGLRTLQEPARLRQLLERVSALVDEPVLVKISPDLADEDVDAVCRVVLDCGLAGLIATNTTSDTTLVPGAQEQGGLSGRVLAARSEAVLRRVADQLFGRCLLISVGGISSGADVYRRLRAGASLVQVYTALIYAGPSLARHLNQELLEQLEQDRIEEIKEIIGMDVKSRPTS